MVGGNIDVRKQNKKNICKKKYFMNITKFQLTIKVQNIKQK